MKKKIGIMGGTFNPIHHGHLILAEAAYEQFGLDEVLFMPSKKPYYKKLTSNVTEEDRVNMVKMAIEDNEHFTFSDLELQREGYTYTVDSLRILTKKNPNTQFYFIMGGDSLYHLETWREPEEILAMSTILVAGRDDMSSSAIYSQIEYLKEKYDHADIFLIHSPSLEISSNDIRKRCKEGKSIRYLLTKKVEAYIKEKHFYEA